MQSRTAPFLQNPHERSKEEHHDNTDNLQRYQRVPERVDIRIQNDADTRDRPAPRKKVHDTHGGADDDTEDNRTDMQLLIDRQHRRNCHEESCSKRTVKMGNGCDTGS